MSHNTTHIKIMQLLGIDRQGSIVCVYAGSLTTINSYTPFGYTAHKTASRSLLGFNGHIQDRHGLYLLGNGYRAYNTTNLRFNSQDNLTSFSRAGLNYYTYAFNNPLNMSDPDGHLPKFLRKPFRSNVKKFSDRDAALRTIETNLKRLTTDDIINNPLQVSATQRTETRKLLRHAQKKSKNFRKVGGTTSVSLDKTLKNAKTLNSIWANPEIYIMSSNLRPAPQTATVLSPLNPRSAPAGRPLPHEDLPPSYEDLPSSYEDLPPSYEDLSFATSAEVIRDNSDF